MHTMMSALLRGHDRSAPAIGTPDFYDAKPRCRSLRVTLRATYPDSVTHDIALRARETTSSSEDLEGRPNCRVL